MWRRGFSLISGCAIGALVTISYFTTGGLLSSAWVNLVQLVVILVGFAIAVPFAVGRGGRMACVDRIRGFVSWHLDEHGTDVGVASPLSSRASVRGLSGTAAEGLRRSRRGRSAARRCVERNRPLDFCLGAGGDRSGGTAASRSRGRIWRFQRCSRACCLPRSVSSRLRRCFRRR